MEGFWSLVTDIIVPSSIVIVGIIKLLPDYILKDFFAKSLAKYEAELNGKCDKELEGLKADLRVQAFQHEKSFAILQEKRALVIEELYSKLVDFFRDVASLVQPFEINGDITTVEKSKKASESSKEFYSYFINKRIYFEQDFCDGISKLYQDTVSLANKYNIKELHGADKLRIGDECAKRLNDDLEPLMKELESEFRKIIGVTSK